MIARTTVELRMTMLGAVRMGGRVLYIALDARIFTARMPGFRLMLGFVVLIGTRNHALGMAIGIVV
jgi:hypothetical protein